MYTNRGEAIVMLYRHHCAISSHGAYAQLILRFHIANSVWLRHTQQFTPSMLPLNRSTVAIRWLCIYHLYKIAKISTFDDQNQLFTAETGLTIYGRRCGE